MRRAPRPFDVEEFGLQAGLAQERFSNYID